MIRWKKRRNGWALFEHTSKQAIAWVIVVKQPGRRRQIAAQLLDNKCWLQATSVEAAKRWCLSMPKHRRQHVIDENVAIVVRPDGVVEERAVERTADIVMLKHGGGPWGKITIPVEEIVLRGLVHAITWDDPWTGSYVEWRIMTYAQPKQQEIASELAKTKLEYMRSQFQQHAFQNSLR